MTTAVIGATGHVGSEIVRGMLASWRSGRRARSRPRRGPPRLVSFYPGKVTITIDGEKLKPAPGQTVSSHGPDRNLSVDEIGGSELGAEAVPAEA